MSIVSSSTGITDIPNVNTAAQRLNELAQRMKSEEFGFRDNDVENIDKIIESLRELEGERRKAHDDLEVQTIEASILRHRLQFLPSEIKKEISAAVNSARQSNATELTRLQEKLDSINNNIELMQKQHEELEKDNAILHPQRDNVREEHDEIIMQLNQRLAEKAGKQIVLNETRDRLRETNQKIVDLEEGIVQLKEDLIQERADARMEKKRLKKAVYDTTLKTREQKEANVAKKKEVDELTEHVMESEAELDNIRKNIRRFETSKSRLEGQERALVSQYNKEIKQNQELKIKGEEIARQIIKEEEEFEKKRVGLEARIKELNFHRAEADVINTDLTARKMELQSDLDEKMVIRKNDQIRVKAANAKLQNAKIELVNKAEEVGRLSQENINMEDQTEGLDETHKSIIETLTKQIEEAREALAKERAERMELQGEKDLVQKGIEDFNTQTSKYMAEMNKRINNGKNEHDRLTREGVELQKTIREAEVTIKRLKQELSDTEAALVNQKESCRIQIENLEAEILTLEKNLGERKQEMVDRMPAFLELEEKFKEQTEQYDKMKKNIVSTKNEKLSLDESVKRGKKEIEKMVKPTIDLEKKVKQKREEALEQLRTQGKDVTEVETKIYTFGVKLKTAIEENDRFLKANVELEDDISTFKKELNENDSLLGKLETNLVDLRENLAEDWNEDSKMEQEFASRDKVLVDQLGGLLDKTGRREGIISGITHKLEGELQMLAQFLDNVASHRPKESRIGGKKGQMTKSEAPEGALNERELSILPLTAMLGPPQSPVIGSLSRRSPVPPITPKPDGINTVPNTSRSYIMEPNSTARSQKKQSD